MNDKLKLAKGATKFVAGYCASFVVVSIIKSNVIPTKSRHKLYIWIGANVAGMMVAHEAEKYISRVFDEYLESGRKLIAKIKENA